MDNFDEERLSSQDFDSYQKEVLLCIFNLWQITRQHEDDLKETLSVIKEMNKNMNAVWGKLNSLPVMPSSNKSGNKDLLLACIIASVINVIVSVLLIITIIRI